MNIKENIIEYCKLNKIVDTESFINECLTIGFNIKKYGISPKDNFQIEKNIKHIDETIKDNIKENTSTQQKEEECSKKENKVLPNVDNVKKITKKKIKIIKK